MKIKVSKEKLVMSITIGIACFALMLVMFMQFKVVKQTDITAIETMRESELRLELSNWNEKYDELNEKYQEVTTKIQEYKNEKESDAQTAQLLEQELEQLNESLGKTDVEGQGVIITLQDNDNSEQKISAEELMIIVNYLRDAGAEAISINNQRVINNTYITLINNSFIKVNSQRVTSPYEIKAIGNSEYLKSSLIGNGGYAEKITSLGQQIKIEEKKKVNIQKYDEEITTKYIEEN